MHVILPGYAIPLKGLICVVFHRFVLQISVGYLAVCYIVLDCFSIPGSSSPVSRTESLETQRFKASFFVPVHMIFALGMTVILPTILGGE